MKFHFITRFGGKYGKEIKEKRYGPGASKCFISSRGRVEAASGFCAKKYRPVTQWDERRVISEIQIFDAVERSSYSQG